MTTAEIDLDAKHLVYNIGVFGSSDLKEHIFNLRRPEIYGEICKNRDEA